MITIVATLGGGNYGIPRPYYRLCEKLKKEKISGGAKEIVALFPENGMPRQEIFEKTKLLILPGGMDVSPMRYGEIPAVSCGPSDPHLEYFDTFFLRKFIERGTPVFGICRGFQTLNVFFEGRLIQHLRTHPNSGEYRENLVHKVYSPDFSAKKGTGTLLEVNSLHHQAVPEEFLGEGLTSLLGCNTQEGFISEAFIHNSLPIAGVQWHPEEIMDSFSLGLIAKILGE